MGWVGLAFFWMLLELVFSFKKLPLLWAAWLNPFSIATFLAESRTWVLAWITFEAVFKNVLYCTGLSILGPKLLILIFGFQDSSFCKGTSSSSDWSVQRTTVNPLSYQLSNSYLTWDR